MSSPRRYTSDQRDAAARQTRSRILDAAEHELIRHGYHAMTIASLARAAERQPADHLQLGRRESGRGEGAVRRPAGR